MKCNQCKFKTNFWSPSYIGGLAFRAEDDALMYVVDGDDGDIYYPDEIKELVEFDDWIDISETVLGDD